MVASKAQGRRLKILLEEKSNTQLRKMKKGKAEIADIIDEILNERKEGKKIDNLIRSKEIFEDLHCIDE
jgi:predicted CopG family antitoxin